MNNGLTYNVGEHFTSFGRIFPSPLSYDKLEKELRFSKGLRVFGVGNCKLFQVQREMKTIIMKVDGSIPNKEQPFQLPSSLFNFIG